jgi:hypothetical protein
MSKENDEKVVKEIIEYANNEIKKSKKKFTTILISVIAGIALIATAIFFAFAIEMPVPYTEGMVEVEIPEDEGKFACVSERLRRNSFILEVESEYILLGICSSCGC